MMIHRRKKPLSWAVAASLVTVLVLAFAHAEGPRQLFGASYAVVIGIDEYPVSRWPNLEYAVKDARAVANYLKTQGFHVEALYNEVSSKQEILARIHRLAHKLDDDDRVIVFFAGHGYTEKLGGKDWGYVVPADAGDESSSYISMEEIVNLSGKMGTARHQLFIMDACYGGMLGLDRRGVKPANTPRSDYIEVVTQRQAREILTAGGKDQQVLDGGPFGHSFFTGYLLKGLRDGDADRNLDGFITFSELASYVIPAATNAAQTPVADRLPQHEGGEFVFRSPYPARPEASDQLDEGNKRSRTVPRPNRTGAMSGPECASRIMDYWGKMTKPAKKIAWAHHLMPLVTKMNRGEPALRAWCEGVIDNLCNDGNSHPGCTSR